MVELSIPQALELMSIVIDCADQAVSTLPHFVYKVQEIRRHGINLHLIGFLHRGLEIHLHLYSLTDEFATVLNHTIACLASIS